MIPFTRRRLLRGAAAALLAGAAGCNGEDGRSVTGTPGEGRFDGTVPEHYSLRNAENEPPLRLDPSTETATGTERASPERRVRRARGFVASEEAANRVAFADVEGADGARRFLADTDYESETVYVETRSVRECYSLSLCDVSWTQSSIHTYYGSVYRDADVACDADATDAVSTLIRIPEALDPDAVRNHGSGWGSSGCHLRRRARGTDERTTEPPNFGPASPANRTATATERRTATGVGRTETTEGGR